ncbi:hypothetical protein [Rothia nasimurium]|uniref:hypothetical protein n=1 Tax=Rothia nasimurium TaxID=85336 RepID=UPI001F309C0D|nr:hypothetical protein [Rothia nasimurium]
MPSQLIVMLTYNDCTVDNAAAIFEACAESPAQFWGFKEKKLPPEQMKELFARMKECGKTTFLEVVEYDEAESLAGAQLAVDCGCDILMGTTYYPSVHTLCRENDIKYMPFVGEVSERPSILEGTPEGMLNQIRRYAELGVDGVDLLGFRYIGDAETMIHQVIADSPLPVCLAGSIDSYQRLDFVKETQPWAFTIGSAFFDQKFGSEFADQITAVDSYMKS